MKQRTAKRIRRYALKLIVVLTFIYLVGYGSL